MKPDTNYYRNGEDLHFKMIPHEEERELFRKAKAGDAQAREFLIRNHLLFVARYGTKKAKGMLRNDEVTSALNEALMTAIDRFNPEYRNRFARFLIPFLKGAMARLWRSKNPVDVPPPGPDSEFFSTSAQFIPVPHTLSQANTDDSELDGNQRRTISQLSRISREGGEISALTDPAVSPDEEAEESDQKARFAGLLKEFRAKFTPFENRIIDLIYIQGLNRSEAGRELGKSREWIRVKNDEIIKKLRKLYKSRGVTGV